MPRDPVISAECLPDRYRTSMAGGETASSANVTRLRSRERVRDNSNHAGPSGDVGRSRQMNARQTSLSRPWAGHHVHYREDVRTDRCYTVSVYLSYDRCVMQWSLDRGDARQGTIEPPAIARPCRGARNCASLLSLTRSCVVPEIFMSSMVSTTISDVTVGATNRLTRQSDPVDARRTFSDRHGPAPREGE